MDGADPRLGSWLDIVGDLLRGAAPELPVELLAGQLGSTFDAPAVSWSESLDPARSRIFPAHRWAAVPVAEWEASGLLARHPLVRWFAATADPGAQTLGRIPAAVVPTRDVRAWQQVTGPYGVTCELSMPLLLAGPEHRAFVLARDGADFDDRDLALARRLQPALAGVARLARVFAAHPPPLPLGEHPLTSRELAVLSLLAAGHTAESIARRLDISPRTVHKHLEHAYGKLGVRDKVSAVRRAQFAGILPAPRSAVRTIPELSVRALPVPDRTRDRVG